MRARFIPAGAGNTASTGRTGQRLPVYPRWRGEHGHKMTLTFDRNGLSPLARGTLVELCFFYAARRFIPAGAGNTIRGKPKKRVKSVYPRWRGEHPLCGCDSLINGGLSPLARGTRARADIDPAKIRFIPAGAGNTTRGSATPAGAAVYPRWRGEHFGARGDI